MLQFENDLSLVESIERNTIRYASIFASCVDALEMIPSINIDAKRDVMDDISLKRKKRMQAPPPPEGMHSNIYLSSLVYKPVS